MREERMPPLSVQYKEGYYAFTKGWMRNSYDADTMKGKEWQRGFNKAYFDNLSKLKK